MQLTVKTLKGSRFQIRVNPTDTIMAVKKKIEEVQGKDSYPCGQQLLIHSGKVLKDEKTLEESNVGEDGFLVVMLSKSKTSGACGTSSAQPPTAATIHPATTVTTTTAEAPPQAPTSLNLESQSERATTEVPGDSYGQAASNIVADTNREQIINQLMDMGGGNWDRDTVIRALRAAYNNPERAVEYLYSGIPEAVEVAVPVAHLPSPQMSVQGVNPSDATIHESPSLSGLPNSAPLNMFPQGTPGAGAGAGAGGGSLGFLRQNQQFQALRTMVQSNPQILQPMLQELSKQNPQLLRLIQEHHAEFLQLINEPVEDVEGAEGDLFDQPEEMPHAINVTPEEQLAIERLEAMGFDRARVVEAFLACDRNEELAANYLLENGDDED